MSDSSEDDDVIELAGGAASGTSAQKRAASDDGGPPSHVEGAAAAPREKPGAAFDVCIMVKELKTDKSGRTVVEKWVKRKPGDTTPGHQVEVGINVKADTKAS